MDVDEVPAEMWMEIFEWLPSSRDLHAVSLTCSRFHGLAVRALHRHVIWQTPEAVAHNLPVWNSNPGMEAVTHTLQLGVSRVPETLGGRFVQPSGQISWQPMAFTHNAMDTFTDYTISYYNINRRHSFATAALQDAIFDRITSFTNLHTLVLHNMVLFHRHMQLIHAIPQLRTLRIDLCVVPPPQPQTAPLDHSTLPITDLTLTNLRRRVVEVHGDRQVTVDDDVRHVLRLALAHGLCALRVDSTADVFRYVFSTWEMEHHGRPLPPALATLVVQRKQFFVAEVQPTFPGESTFPDGSLHSFLGRARALRTYTTYHAGPPQVFAPEMLRALENYVGPVETATIANTRAMRTMGLLKCGYGANRDGVVALTSLAEQAPDLRALLVEFRVWDDELMHAVSSLFRGLCRLKIVYAGGGPDENTLVSLGPEFLARMAGLQVLHLYSLSPNMSPMTYLFDCSYESVEEELCNLVIPWNRWCPALREVQLHPHFVLRRGFAGGKWRVDHLEEVPAVEEFDFGY